MSRVTASVCTLVLCAASIYSAPPAGPQPLKVSGTRFEYSDGRPFAWRGITAFRLLEMEANGRTQAVEAYLAWASAQRLTVLRVLAMAKQLFELPPDRGAAHLEAFLKRAATHGLYVEVVALADTASYPIDVAVHVRRIAAICAKAGNAVLELANEPYHGTHAEAVQSGPLLDRLAREAPTDLPTAVGAALFPEAHLGGTYVTMHALRSEDHGGWGHVRDLIAGRDLMARAGKPVISDEPMGAGARYDPGRRDDNPERFRAAALLTRMIGMGATFHYEGGLQARRPTGRELDSFRAWQEAWTLLPQEGPLTLTSPGEPSSPVASLRGKYLAAHVASANGEAKLLVIGRKGPITVEWRSEWREQQSRTWPESIWRTAVRTPI